MGEVKIIPSGTRVKIKDAGLNGTIVGVAMNGIGNTYIEYRVIYWMAGERKDVWVFEFEIEILKETSKKAGFVDYETDSSKLIG